MRREIADSKAKLEEIIGKSVHHISCPGGRWDARVAKVAREVGYQSVSTSRLGANGPNADHFRLARMAVTCDTNLNQFDRLCRGELSPRDKARNAVLTVAKSLLGNGAYQKARGAVLNKSVEGHS
jgi:peptidoglycan/xylan/chitin deacetylase (PgdA/CDA1 family)